MCPLDVWDRYRDVLASELDAEAWVTVSQSAGALQGPGLAWPRHKPSDINAKQVAALLTMRENALAAFNTLSELADHPEAL